MTGEFEGMTAIVTGGASGIGEAIARSFVDGGGRCLVTDIQDERGRAVAADIGAGYRHLDVTDEEQLRSVVADWSAEVGRLDTFFSNAGLAGVVGPIEETSLEDWRFTMDVLLTSTFLGIKAVTPILTAQGSGSIVCTASVASLRGGLGPHVYTAAKHGVWGLVQSVAAQYAGLGLRINCVAPGGTVSALSAEIVGGGPDGLESAYERLAAGSRSGRPTTAADVADAALFLGGRRAGRINGACLVVDGGEDVVASKALSYFEQSGTAVLGGYARGGT